MLRFITLLLILSLHIGAKTRIQVTYTSPSGEPLNGQVNITSFSSFTSISGSVVPAGFKLTVPVRRGAMTVDLEPNIGATPSGTSYSVETSFGAGGSSTETWIVPNTTATLGRADVVSTPVARPNISISTAQLTQSSASLGQVLAWSGSAWLPASLTGDIPATASAVLNVSSVSDGTCLLDSTSVTVTGAALGGRTTLGLSFQPPQGITMIPKVTGPNSVKIEVCNWSGATYDPPSATYYIGVTQ